MRSAVKLAEERSARKRETAQALETLKEAYSASDSSLRELGSIQQAELDTLNAEHTKEREDFEARLAAEHAARLADVQAAREEADRRVLQARDAAEARQADSLAHLTQIVDRLQRELAIAVEENGMTTTNLRAKHELALKTAMAQHDAEVEALRATLAQTHADADRLFEQMEAEHAQSRAAAAEEVRRVAVAHAAELSAVTLSHDSTLKTVSGATREEHARAMAALKARHEAERAEIEIALETQLTAARRQVDTLTAAAAEADARHSAILRSQARAAQEEKAAALEDTRVAAETARYQAIEALKAAHAEEVARLRAQLAEAEAAAEEFHGAATSYEEQLAVAKGEFNSQLEAVRLAREAERGMLTENFGKLAGHARAQQDKDSREARALADLAAEKEAAANVLRAEHVRALNAAHCI